MQVVVYNETVLQFMMVRELQAMESYNNDKDLWHDYIATSV